jgi:hypothetical protein
VLTIAAGVLTPDQADRAVDRNTIVLLLGMSGPITLVTTAAAGLAVVWALT